MITGMEKDGRQRTGAVRPGSGWLRQVYELFFSLNVGLGSVVAVAFGGGLHEHGCVTARFFRLERDVGFWLQHFIYYRLGWQGGGGAVSGYTTLLLYVAVLAALLYFLLRCIRRTPVAKYLLVWAGGFLALGVAPACWFYVDGRYGLPWYPVETAVYCVFALLYLLNKWAVPALVAIPIVCIHYGFWYLRFSECPHGLSELLVLISGFCACLVWGAYVAASRSGASQGGASVDRR
jgi:hypothetical protein